MKSSDFNEVPVFGPKDYILGFTNGNPIKVPYKFISDAIAMVVGDYLPLDGSSAMTGLLKEAPFVTITFDGSIGQSIDFNAANSNNIVLSGTGADEIVSFGTAPSGTRVLTKVRYPAGPGHGGGSQLTASADIITLDGLDIFTGPGDVHEWISEGSGVWREINRTKFGAGYLYTSGGTVTDSFEISNSYGQALMMDGASNIVSFVTGSGAGFLADGSTGYTFMGTGDQFFKMDHTADTATISTQNGGTFVFDGTAALVEFNIGTGIRFGIDGADDNGYILTAGGLEATFSGNQDYVNFIGANGNTSFLFDGANDEMKFEGAANGVIATFSGSDNLILFEVQGQDVFLRIDGTNDRVRTATLAGAGWDVNGSNITLTIAANGVLAFQNLDTYADNAAALAGGLVATNVYKTAAGELRIVV